MNVAELLPGTLDLLVLKAVSLGPRHGYGILLRIETISKGCFAREQGTVYPALYRLEDRGLLKSGGSAVAGAAPFPAPWRTCSGERSS